MGNKKNKQTKNCWGASSCKHAEQATGRLNESACRSVNQKTKNGLGFVFFFLFPNDDNMRSARFRCSPISGTPLQGTLLEQSALHTCCHVTFIHTPQEPNHDWIYPPGMDSRLWLCCTATTTVCSDRLQPQKCMYSPHSDTHSITRVRLGWTNLGREEKRPSSQQMRSSSGGVTFENALSVQHVSRDNHCVEALGEPRSAGGFEGLARPTPLRNETRWPVKKWAN